MSLAITYFVGIYVLFDSSKKMRSENIWYWWVPAVFAIGMIAALIYGLGEI